ncbi:hypothetical protein L1987_81275 [Smallanthus sonchifolius]|uniref:Uncharacterized protein n=1 Tax=Smallanthus sonchifolius TaxID=185202 RepID=A0ACB8YQ03_9ASTR|nr:hypothetical protein L1987_81275 [Smallanthus sonchifolius]
MSGKRSSDQGQSSLGYLFGSSGELDNDESKVLSPLVCTSGGGQSSLGYLFGDSKALDQQSNRESNRSSPSVCVPPYGTDDVEEESPKQPLPSPSKSYVYHKVDAKNSKDVLMTGRPSTRVTSVPGGASSVGYLFGDK